MTERAYQATRRRYVFSNRAIAIGDSVTMNNGSASAYRVGNSFWDYGCALSGQRILNARNAGNPGDTTASMLARIDAEVIAYAPGYCLILGGTNDTGQGIALSTSTANITAMVNKLKAANIVPVLGTIPPNSNVMTGGTAADRHAGISKINAWIRHYAARNGLTCLDFHAQLVDPTTGNFTSGYSSDGTHPNNVGHRIMGQYMATTLAPLMPNAPPWLVTSNDDGSSTTPVGVSHLTLPVMLNPNGSGVPDGWQTYGDPGLTMTVAADAPNVLGNWAVMTVGTSGNHVFEHLSGVYAETAGNIIAFAGVLQTVGIEAGTLNFDVQMAFSGSAAVYKAASGWAIDMTRGVFYLEFPYPTGATGYTARVWVNSGGTGVVKVGQATLLNLTALGIA